MAGNALQAAGVGFIGDDSGQNISARNPYYSELTGIYWAWKNTRQDVVGSCHYRRFFTAKPCPILHRLKKSIWAVTGLRKESGGLIYTSSVELFRDRILTEC